MIPGPAADIPEYLLALELLSVRGCEVVYKDGTTPGTMQAYLIQYAKRGSTLTNVRMMWADERGAKQALQLLEELNAPLDTYDAMAARYSTALAKSLQKTKEATLTAVLSTAWQEYQKEEK